MDHEPPGESVRVYKELLLDRDLQAKRQEFCRTAVSSLASVASWLGLDSFLGGGDLAIAASSGVGNANDERHHAFRAAAAVVEMSSELAAGAVDLLDRGYRFAAAALIRQLIETEYLLTAFAIDFSEAARWARRSPRTFGAPSHPRRCVPLGAFPIGSTGSTATWEVTRLRQDGCCSETTFTPPPPMTTSSLHRSGETSPNTYGGSGPG